MDSVRSPVICLYCSDIAMLQLAVQLLGHQIYSIPYNIKGNVDRIQCIHCIAWQCTHEWSSNVDCCVGSGTMTACNYLNKFIGANKKGRN
jgi:hypothetical protein